MLYNAHLGHTSASSTHIDRSLYFDHISHWNNDFTCVRSTCSSLHSVNYVDYPFCKNTSQLLGWYAAVGSLCVQVKLVPHFIQSVNYRWGFLWYEQIFTRHSIRFYTVTRVILELIMWWNVWFNPGLNLILHYQHNCSGMGNTHWAEHRKHVGLVE